MSKKGRCRSTCAHPSHDLTTAEVPLICTVILKAEVGKKSVKNSKYDFNITKHESAKIMTA